MPPKSYILWMGGIVGAGLLSLPPTMGFSILIIYWVFQIAAGLMVVAATWRLVFVASPVIWPAFVITATYIIWLIGFVDPMFAFDYPKLMWGIAILPSMSSAASAIAIWRIQEIATQIRTPAAVYIYASLAIAFITVAFFMISGSSHLVKLPKLFFSAARLMIGVPIIVACAFIAWALFRSASAIDGEFWIIPAVILPVALVAFVAMKSSFASLGFSTADGITIVLSPLFALIGAFGFWRLASLMIVRSRAGYVKGTSLGGAL